MKTNSAAGGSGIPARGLSTTDRARRGVVHARSYGIGLRIADNLHGWLDARRSEAPLAALPWPGRLQATFDENAARILAGTRDVLAPQVRTLRAGRLELERLERALADAEARLRDVKAATPRPGRGEVHLPPEALVGRADRAAEVLRGRLRAEVDDLRGRRDDVSRRLVEAEASVDEEFRLAVEVVRRMRDFYQRRLQTYARRFLPRRDDVASLEHRISLPAWATEPCPWLPPHETTTDAGALRLVS